MHELQGLAAYYIQVNTNMFLYTQKHVLVYYIGPSYPPLHHNDITLITC